MFLCKGNVANKSINLVHKFNYYMASSASGQDERILCSDWLPERARWRPYPLQDFPRLSRVPQEKVLFVALCFFYYLFLILLFYFSVL